MGKTNDNGHDAAPSKRVRRGVRLLGPHDAVLAMWAKHAREGDHEAARRLYGLIAELIRSRTTAQEAALMVPWFERLAAGERPDAVFPRNRRGKGRPRSRDLNDAEIAWIVRENRNKGTKPGSVYAAVAKANGLKPGTVANLYSKLKNELPR